MQPGETNVSEDCLYINVWTPTTSPTANLPVRVFIHGGGFQAGSGSSPGYAGCQVASDANVVAVTFNYRLGILGFLALPGLNDTTAGGTTGTWGLLDQRLALSWIQQNIRAFGGDPSRLLLTGQSAGGYSVFLHTLMPGSRGLFAAAAPVSGSSDVMAVDFLSDAYAKGRDVAAALQCTGLSLAGRKECLLRAPAVAVIAAQGALGKRAELFPAIDGVQIPRAPLRILKDGVMARVPLLIGVNANEGVLEATGATQFNFDIDRAEFLAALRSLVPAPKAFEKRLFQQYNPNVDVSWFGSLTKAITEAGYWCPSYRAARYFSKHSGSPVRMYVINAARPMSGCVFKAVIGQDFGLDLAMAFGAFHGYDIPLSFLAPQQYPDSCNYTEGEAQLGSFLSGALSAFAATGSPLPPRSATLAAPQLRNVSWPSWHKTSQPLLWLDESAPGLYPAAGVMDVKCKLWDDILEYNVKRGSNYDP